MCVLAIGFFLVVSRAQKNSRKLAGNSSTGPPTKGQYVCAHPVCVRTHAELCFSGSRKDLKCVVRHRHPLSVSIDSHVQYIAFSFYTIHSIVKLTQYILLRKYCTEI